MTNECPSFLFKLADAFGWNSASRLNFLHYSLKGMKNEDFDNFSKKINGFRSCEFGTSET